MTSPVPPVARITPLVVFQSAAPFQQALILVLLLACLAAVAVLALKLAAGRRSPGGSAFLSGLRFAGPVIGVVGACRAAFAMTLGVANVPITVTPKMLTPGFAEIFLTLGLGCLAGAVAAVAHWLVQSRTDRRAMDA